jgi:transcriptional regulator with XRE-family HTH domain
MTAAARPKELAVPKPKKPTSAITTPGELLGQRVGDFRRRKRWTQQQLSDRLTEIGHPIHRAVIARIEQGGSRARNVTLEEAFAFAVALEVSPLYLATPFDTEQEISLARGLSVDGVTARRWIKGQAYVNTWASADQPGSGAAVAGVSRADARDPGGRFFFSLENRPPEEVAAAYSALDRADHETERLELQRATESEWEVVDDEART